MAWVFLTIQTAVATGKGSLSQIARCKRLAPAHEDQLHATGRSSAAAAIVLLPTFTRRMLVGNINSVNRSAVK